MKTVKDKVRAFLEYSQVYRDDDMRLFLDFWAKEGLVLSDQQRKTFLNRCTPPETIRRHRQELQHDHPELFGSSEDVRRKRRKKEQEQHAHYANKRAEELSQEELLDRIGYRIVDD